MVNKSSVPGCCGQAELQEQGSGHICKLEDHGFVFEARAASTCISSSGEVRIQLSIGFRLFHLYEMQVELIMQCWNVQFAAREISFRVNDCTHLYNRIPSLCSLRSLHLLQTF